MFTFETFCILCHILSNGTGILANGLLIFLVRFKTPESLKTYSVLILNCAIFDLIACLTALMVQQRIIPTGTGLFFEPSGPCRLIGGRFCHTLHTITLHCYTHSMWSLTVSFVYRFLVLRGIKISRKELFVILAGVYQLSLLQLVTFALSYDDQSEIIKVIHDRFPNYDLDPNFISGSLSILDWKMLYTCIHICVPVFPCYLTIFWCRQKTINFLEKSEFMNEKTKRMHRTLLHALTYQVFLPGLFIAAVSVYVLGAFHIYHHPYLELSCFVFVGLVPSLAPLGTLYFVLPYNRWIRRTIFSSFTKVRPVSTNGQTARPIYSFTLPTRSSLSFSQNQV